MPYRSLERPNFFTGRLLSVEDLQREQDYFREKVRLHNRCAHGWGVVSGLQVTVSGDGVVLSPGLALDCAGNELVLDSEVQLSLTGLSGRRYLTVRYVEQPSGLVPTLGGDPQPTSIKEAASVNLASTHPLTGLGDHKVGDPGCGADHAICLASLSARGGRWRATPAAVRDGKR